MDIVINVICKFCYFVIDSMRKVCPIYIVNVRLSQTNT